eukprot:COSAG04_NODE_5544_length_1576_cov_1.107651_1_plen_150_part_10
MLRLAALLAISSTAAASSGQGCYDTNTHQCSNAQPVCSPHSCNVQGGGKVWVSAASATPCSVATSCVDSAMADGVAAGNAITAAAKAFSDASGVAAKKTAYTDTLQGLAQGTGSNDAGDDIDAYIISALDATGIFADATCTGTATTAVSG